ncbi:hypothetical protein, partial [Klebsiella aerogenes]|uniref:hypothetical protein n=1 Tax=Klebsiella aerogenes TaxID=548 RepID=UPI001CC5E2AE
LLLHHAKMQADDQLDRMDGARANPRLVEGNILLRAFYSLADGEARLAGRLRVVFLIKQNAMIAYSCIFCNNNQKIIRK